MCVLLKMKKKISHKNELNSIIEEMKTFKSLVVSFGEEEHGLGGAIGRLQQALTGGIFPEVGQQEPVGHRHLREQVFTCWRRSVIQLQIMMEGTMLVTYHPANKIREITINDGPVRETQRRFNKRIFCVTPWVRAWK